MLGSAADRAVASDFLEAANSSCKESGIAATVLISLSWAQIMSCEGLSRFSRTARTARAARCSSRLDSYRFFMHRERNCNPSVSDLTTNPLVRGILRRTVHLGF